MPHEPSITVLSTTLTDWGDPGEHFLWGTYDLIPRPSWWQRICGKPATAEFRLRVADLVAALEPGDRSRFRQTERRLRTTGDRWSVSLDGRTELMDLMERFLCAAGYLIETPAAEPGTVPDEEAAQAACLRHYFSHDATDRFDQVVTELLTHGG